MRYGTTMQALLDWTMALSVRDAALLSLLVNVVVFALALTFGHTVVRMWKTTPVAMTPPALTRMEIALAAACVVVNSFVMLAGWLLFLADVVRVDGNPRVWRWGGDAIVLLFSMDLAMYVTHRIAHHPLAFRWVHGIHHRYDSPRPLTLFVLHPIEVVGFGGLWIAVLCTHAFSLGGVLVYLTINALFGTVGHLGVEPLPRRWVTWPALGAIGTSTFHARHHQTPTSNFGFYTAIWDRLFGTLDRTYRSRFAALPEDEQHDRDAA